MIIQLLIQKQGTPNNDNPAFNGQEHAVVVGIAVLPRARDVVDEKRVLFARWVSRHRCGNVARRRTHCHTVGDDNRHRAAMAEQSLHQAVFFAYYACRKTHCGVNGARGGAVKILADLNATAVPTTTSIHNMSLPNCDCHLEAPTK